MKFQTLSIGALALAVCVAVAAPAFAKGSGGAKGGSHSVRGHVRKDGTYVPPHHATNPNNTHKDNWSSKPNVNPYTGNAGTKDAEK